MNKRRRWKCDKSGCFLENQIDLGIFDDCFPGKIGGGDIDFSVAMNGKVLFIEFKKEGQDIPVGQQILFKTLTMTSLKVLVCICWTNSEFEITSYGLYYGGEYKFRGDCTDADFRAGLKKWSGVGH